MGMEYSERLTTVSDDETKATLIIGPRHSITADPKFIEMLMVSINQHLQSKIGYGWLDVSSFEPGDRISSILVSRASDISISWPTGYEPFEAPNEMVDDLRANPVADLPDDSGK